MSFLYLGDSFHNASHVKSVICDKENCTIFFEGGSMHNCKKNTECYDILQQQLAKYKGFK